MKVAMTFGTFHNYEYVNCTLNYSSAKSPAKNSLFDAILHPFDFVHEFIQN